MAQWPGFCFSMASAGIRPPAAGTRAAMAAYPSHVAPGGAQLVYNPACSQCRPSLPIGPPLPSGMHVMFNEEDQTPGKIPHQNLK
jgi:hypothetical protein